MAVHNKTPLTDQDELDIAHGYAEEGWAYGKIGDDYHIGVPRIKQILLAHNVAIRDKWKKTTEADADAVISHRPTCSCAREISEKTGIGISTVSKILRESRMAYPIGYKKRQTEKPGIQKSGYYETAVCELGRIPGKAYCLLICEDNCDTPATNGRRESRDRFMTKRDRIITDDTERAKSRAMYRAFCVENKMWGD